MENIVIKYDAGGKQVDKKPLIVVSICAVVLIVLGSLSNVVGYQTVQSSNQSIIKERINQRELLFQTIVDIANNKEIQRIILKSQMMNGKFLDTDVKLPTPITKSQLRQIFFIALILSNIIGKSRIHSMVEQYQMNSPGMQKEINDVIEKDITLNGEITQLSTLKCDCEENNNLGDYPSTICGILGIIATVSLIIGILTLYITLDIFDGSFLSIPLFAICILFLSICSISFSVGGVLKCSWVYIGPFL